MTDQNKEQIEELKKIIEADKEARRVRQRELRADDEHKEASKGYHKKYYDRLTPEEKETRYKKYRISKQEEKAGRPKPVACEVCSATNNRIVFDHCHNSDKFRGWLCNNCNLILGAVNDDPVLLEKLAVYLRTHNT